MAELDKGQRNEKLINDSMSVIYQARNITFHIKTKQIQL